MEIWKKLLFDLENKPAANWMSSGGLVFYFNFLQHGKYMKQFDITGESNISFHLSDITVL